MKLCFSTVFFEKPCHFVHALRYVSRFARTQNLVCIVHCLTFHWYFLGWPHVTFDFYVVHICIRCTRVIQEKDVCHVILKQVDSLYSDKRCLYERHLYVVLNIIYTILPITTVSRVFRNALNSCSILLKTFFWINESDVFLTVCISMFLPNVSWTNFSILNRP